jgi:putative MATE family efflux protein
VGATVLMNFLLDPLFIFGWGPVAGHGVMGAAIATLVTQALASFAGVLIFLRGRHGIHLTWSGFKPDPAYLKRAFFLGVPGSLELSTRALGLMIMSFLVASFGTLTIAAYGVGSNILQIVTIPVMGLSMAVSTLVGQNIGAGHVDRASQAAKLGATVSFFLLSGIGAIAWFAAPWLIAFFIPNDADVIREGARFIRVMCLAWGGIGVQLCIVSAFRASGNMLMSMVIAMVSQWMIQFPLAYVLGKHTTLQAQGLWWSFPITNIAVALVSVLWFACGSWKKTRLTEDDEQIARITENVYTEEGIR